MLGGEVVARRTTHHFSFCARVRALGALLGAWRGSLWSLRGRYAATKKKAPRGSAGRFVRKWRGERPLCTLRSLFRCGRSRCGRSCRRRVAFGCSRSLRERSWRGLRMRTIRSIACASRRGARDRARRLATDPARVRAARRALSGRRVLLRDALRRARVVAREPVTHSQRVAHAARTSANPAQK